MGSWVVVSWGWFLLFVRKFIYFFKNGEEDYSWNKVDLKDKNMILEIICVKCY